MIRKSILAIVPIATLTLPGCKVGPDYERPKTETPVQYKADVHGTWKEGKPGDHLAKGDWWKIFGDGALNSLQSQAGVANQELKAAVARVEQARATARAAHSELTPAVKASPNAVKQS